MAKKSNKKGKKINKSKEANSRFNYLVRMVLKHYMYSGYDYLKRNKIFNEDMILNAIEQYKEIGIKNIDKGILGDYHIDKLDFIKVIDYITEVILLSYSYDRNINDCIDHVKNKIIELIKDNSIIHLYLNDNTCIDFINSQYVKTFKNEDRFIIPQCIITVLTYLSAYVMKLENHEIDSIIEKDGKLVYKYSKDMLFKEHIIEKLILDLKTNNVSEEDVNLFNYVKNQRIGAFSKFLPFLTKDERTFFKLNAYKIDIKDYDTNKIPLKINDNSDTWVITHDDLDKIRDERKYAIPNKGICFTFKNNFYINKIEMKENINNILFNIYINNNNNVYIGTWKSNKIAKESTIVIPKLINKEGLFDNDNAEWFDDLGTLVEHDKLRSDIGYLLFCCIYIAYINPNFDTNIVTLSNIKDSDSSGFTKESHYRVGHIRKLPTGYNMSESARKRAIEEGFRFIPNGYTFVKASNIHLEEMKEIII